jgi:hypothetical protein
VTEDFQVRMVYLVNQAIQDQKVKRASALKENLVFLDKEERKETKVSLGVMVQRESQVSVHLQILQMV